ncbi:hypothetical protein G9F73_005535 [Clostridium estertheticum]|uniref:hypothetical protein n=1 Tax=Clostridium estertheticum TaxID=238834 RepID=UPI0013EEA00A|nr:hypothetical protein [Clostridium estertheticum]MBZ9607287.1 hypothetical protein [Clostridium estertheticum]
MKRAKKLMIMGAILMSLTFSVGCSPRSGDVNSLDGKVIDRLPEDQKDTELDKALKSIRKARKESVAVKNGAEESYAGTGNNLPGQSKNMPIIDDLEEKDFEVILDYIENELKIPKKSPSGYDIAPCLDPRINAIYDDEDKGVADGYDNENIYIEEYETEKDDVYSYIFLVRDSKDSPWKVIHHGNNYKE